MKKIAETSTKFRTTRAFPISFQYMYQSRHIQYNRKRITETAPILRTKIEFADCTFSAYILAMHFKTIQTDLKILLKL